MSDSSIHCLIVRSRLNPAPRAAGLLADAHALGITGLTGLECADLYFIEGALNSDDQQRLAAELLSDSVAQTCAWRSSSTVHRPPSREAVALEVALRPGVTDPVAEQIVRCAKVLGIPGVEHAATGQ